MGMPQQSKKVYVKADNVQISLHNYVAELVQAQEQSIVVCPHDPKLYYHKNNIVAVTS